MNFDMDSISTATTRTVTMPDRSLTLGDAADVFVTTPITNLTATTVQAALAELQGDIDGLAGGIKFKGVWDASTGTFPGTGTGAIGDLYIVSVAGTVGGIAFGVGDTLYARVANASTTVFSPNWARVENISDVNSVFGRTGAVVAVAGDYTASQVTNVAAGNIAAVTVQAAIDELDSEKLTNVLTSGNLFVGNGSNVATSVTLSGDATLSNAGVITLAAASLTVAGKVELATSAETLAGTDATRAVTPAGLAANFVPNSGSWAVGGATASASQTGWTTSNVTTTRTIDANAITLQGISDVLSTLIEDLKVKGIILA
jgi:hypothetical protein